MCKTRPGMRCHEHCVQGLRKAEETRDRAIGAGKEPSAYCLNRITYWKAQLRYTPEGLQEDADRADALESNGRHKEAAHLREQVAARQTHADRGNALANPRNMAMGGGVEVTAEKMKHVRIDANVRPLADTSTAARVRLAGSTTEAEQLERFARSDESIAVLAAVESNPAASAETVTAATERKAVLVQRKEKKTSDRREKGIAMKAAKAGKTEGAAARVTTKRVAHVQAPSDEETEYDRTVRAREEESPQEQLLLARSHSVEARIALADNPHATKQVLNILASSTNKTVARFARNNKNYEG